MWVIDIRHWLDDTLSGPAVPQLRFKVQKLVEIISYATAKDAGVPFSVQPLCWRKPKRKACPGELEISMNPETEQIHWVCPDVGMRGW